jgi:uncharacterized protein YkwD
MKKSILILAAILITNVGRAQTALETSFLNALNKYRQGKGLALVSYDASASVIAKDHTTYMSKCLDLKHNLYYDSDGGHDEKYDVPGFTERTLNQRASSINNVSFVGEICYTAFDVEVGTDDKKAVADMIKGFDASPGHKKIMSFDFGDTQGLAKPIVALSVIKKPSNTPGFVTYIVAIDFGYANL